MRRAEALLSGRRERVPRLPEDALRGVPVVRAKLDRAALLGERAADERHPALEVQLAEALVKLSCGVELATGGERHPAPVEQARAQTAAEAIPRPRQPLVDEALELRPGCPTKPHRRHDQRHCLSFERRRRRAQRVLDRASRLLGCLVRTADPEAEPTARRVRPREILVVARLLKLGDDPVELRNEPSHFAAGMAPDEEPENPCARRDAVLTECRAALDRLCEERVAPLELAQAVDRLGERSQQGHVRRVIGPEELDGAREQVRGGMDVDPVESPDTGSGE